MLLGAGIGERQLGGAQTLQGHKVKGIFGNLCGFGWQGQNEAFILEYITFSSRFQLTQIVLTLRNDYSQEDIAVVGAEAF